MASEDIRRMLSTLSGGVNLSDSLSPRDPRDAREPFKTPRVKQSPRRASNRQSSIVLHQQLMKDPDATGAQKLRAKVHAMGLHHQRPSPRVRRTAELAVGNMHVDDWVKLHHLTRKVELPAAQRESLREVFDMIDADHGGTIDLEEMSVIMGAQGFKPHEIREAIRIGDSNGDGELDFEEFVALVGNMGGGRGRISDTTTNVAGDAGNTFPFALVANGYRIKQMIDAFDPANKKQEVLPPRREAISLPKIDSARAVSPRGAIK